MWTYFPCHKIVSDKTSHDHWLFYLSSTWHKSWQSTKISSDPGKVNWLIIAESSKTQSPREKSRQSELWLRESWAMEKNKKAHIKRVRKLILKFLSYTLDKRTIRCFLGQLEVIFSEIRISSYEVHNWCSQRNVISLF